MDVTYPRYVCTECLRKYDYEAVSLSHNNTAHQKQFPI